jgi:hypothetical protein
MPVKMFNCCICLPSIKLEKLTVSQLRVICKGLSLPVSGIKGDLVVRISGKFA